MSASTPIEPAADTLDDLRIEVASLRLVLRAVVTYLASRETESAAAVLTQICGSLEGTGVFAIKADEMETEVRAAAADRARKRMFTFTSDIQNLPLTRATSRRA